MENEIKVLTLIDEYGPLERDPSSNPIYNSANYKYQLVVSRTAQSEEEQQNYSSILFQKEGNSAVKNVQITLIDDASGEKILKEEVEKISRVDVGCAAKAIHIFHGEGYQPLINPNLEGDSNLEVDIRWKLANSKDETIECVINENVATG